MTVKLIEKIIISGNLETGVKGEIRKNQTWFKDCLLVGLLVDMMA